MEMRTLMRNCNSIEKGLKKTRDSTFGIDPSAIENSVYKKEVETVRTEHLKNEAAFTAIGWNNSNEST